MDIKKEGTVTWSGKDQHRWGNSAFLVAPAWLIESSTWKSFKDLSETSQGNTTVLNPLLMILLNDRLRDIILSLNEIKKMKTFIKL